MSAPPSTTRFVDDYLGYLLGQANHALFKDFEREVVAAGLSSIEWRVLATLHDGPALGINELTREVLSKQPTVTKLVQRMHGQGWLKLDADAQDQRRTLVTVTPLGRALALSLLGQARALEAQALAPLSPDEIAALKRLLRRIAHLPDMGTTSAHPAPEAT